MIHLLGWDRPGDASIGRGLLPISLSSTTPSIRTCTAAAARAAAKAMRDYSLTRATNHGLLSIGVYYDPTVSSSAIALSVSMLLNAAHAPPVVPTPALHAAGHQ